ncbi:MAG: triose-phosphate isomerase [Planctomycetes bacterium]|nr:triose-phosphate isomerase [Planctomycetota bacterium]
MVRRLFIAGNWKMNTSSSRAVELAEQVAGALAYVDNIDLAVFPPFVYLSQVAEVLKGTALAVGAQDCFYEDNGAFTGEISTAMLKDVGCSYVIIGHSERRHVIGEADELINRKVLKAVGDGLKPILCVGELLEQRQADETDEVVSRQVKIGLEGLGKADVLNVTIAYEPVWAIGTGETATPEQAQQAHAMIRQLLGELYGGSVAQSVRIQYGGSVKPDNAAELLACPDIDGALVGGASLKVTDFAGIVAGGR